MAAQTTWRETTGSDPVVSAVGQQVARGAAEAHQADGQAEVEPGGAIAHVDADQLRDSAQALPQRVAVDEQRGRGLVRVALMLQVHLERSEELAAALRVALRHPARGGLQRSGR